MGTYGLSYGDLWKQSTVTETRAAAVDFCLEKSPRVEMGPCAEPARSTSRAQLPPRPAKKTCIAFIREIIIRENRTDLQGLKGKK